MSVNAKMTAIADEIRELSGTTETMGLDAMASTLNTENTNFASNLTAQDSLIAQIQTALGGKAGGSSSNENIETCTVTLSIQTANSAFNLVWTTVENEEVVMKAVYVPYNVDYLYPTITCVKNSFICIGNSTATTSSSSIAALSGGIELIPGDHVGMQSAYTLGEMFKVTGDASISLS